MRYKIETSTQKDLINLVRTVDKTVIEDLDITEATAIIIYPELIKKLKEVSLRVSNMTDKEFMWGEEIQKMFADILEKTASKGVKLHKKMEKMS